MTHRQFLAWTAWLDMQWERPDRSDLHQIHVASCLLGHDVPPLRVELKSGAQRNVIPAEDIKYASTTDDPSSWWVPEPLTVDQFMHYTSKAGLATKVPHG